MLKLIWPENITVTQFVSEYWQKKPLLIRNAFDLPSDFIDADELAGLSCEEGVESRLIIEAPEENDWLLEQGPFDEERFAELPDSHWTLLVQDVDKHFSDTAALLENFRFIPSWRIDDLMISYAEDKGSVGPHTDSYDVFLIQLFGQRLWKISDQQYSDDDLQENSQVRVLKNFTANREWLLNPGDMLYLPPNVAHWGIARGKCMTGSVGFISPTQQQLFTEWADSCIEKLDQKTRYSDADLNIPEDPALLDDDAINRMTALIRSACTDKANLKSWMGKLVSESKPHLSPHDFAPEEPFNQSQLLAALSENVFIRNPYLRTYYATENQQVLLFANGEVHPLGLESREFASLFCNTQTFQAGQLLNWNQPDVLSCLLKFYNQGYLMIDTNNE